MVVEVRLFAMLRERAGADSVTVELPDGATVREAVDAVGNHHGLAELLDAMPVVMAVNRDYATDDLSLHAGDELALIPPVSGGEQEVSVFSSGPAYDDFMRLVGGHVPQWPGYVELLGMRPLHAEPGHMRFEFNAGEVLLNPTGVVQGGFLAAMLDETMGPAALTALGPGHAIPTLDLNISFLRPARPGRYVADGRVVHLGKTVAFLEGALTDDDGELVARATATSRVVKLG
jgi:molybdopterin converting factor subunit 1